MEKKEIVNLERLIVLRHTALSLLADYVGTSLEADIEKVISAIDKLDSEAQRLREKLKEKDA